MSNRNLDKLQQLLDYHFHLDDEYDRKRTESRIADDPEMRVLNDALGELFEPLARDFDDAPAGLTDRTMSFIDHYEQTRKVDRARPVRLTERDRRSRESSRIGWILGNLRDLATVAAGVMLVFLLSQPGVRYARSMAQRHSCANQMRHVGVAFDSYARDNSGLLPQVRHEVGSKWWNVGSQGVPNTSNTRNFFLLVKQSYLSAKNFICPAVGEKGRIRIQFSPEQLQELRDFANRESVNYSFRLVRKNEGLNMGLGRRNGPLMSDQNPLFADFNAFLSSELDVAGDEDLLRANSPNHNGSGQNVLFDDGRVDFITGRHWGISADDMFTIENVTHYEGTEVPTDEVDAFIAP